MILLKRIIYHFNRLIICLLFCFIHVNCVADEVYICNVGHGAANVIKRNNCAYVIDFGGVYSIIDDYITPFISEVINDNKIRYVINSHAHNDHNSHIGVFCPQQPKQCDILPYPDRAIVLSEIKEEGLHHNFIEIATTGCQHSNG